LLKKNSLKSSDEILLFDQKENGIKKRHHVSSGGMKKYHFDAS
jgi:hypothetical protein